MRQDNETVLEDEQTAE